MLGFFLFVWGGLGVLSFILQITITGQRLQLTVSDRRAKKFMFPVFQHGAICTVGEVFPRSPAATAGLAEDDVIVKIGTLDGARDRVRRALRIIILYNSIHRRLLFAA